MLDIAFWYQLLKLEKSPNKASSILGARTCEVFRQRDGWRTNWPGKENLSGSATCPRMWRNQSSSTWSAANLRHGGVTSPITDIRRSLFDAKVNAGSDKPYLRNVNSPSGVVGGGPCPRSSAIAKA